MGNFPLRPRSAKPLPRIDILKAIQIIRCTVLGLGAWLPSRTALSPWVHALTNSFLYSPLVAANSAMFGVAAARLSADNAVTRRHLLALPIPLLAHHAPREDAELHWMHELLD